MSRSKGGATPLFEVGDSVVLKSGGPKMTVTEVHNGVLGRQISCSWFSGKKAQHDQFPPDALKTAEEEPSENADE